MNGPGGGAGTGPSPARTTPQSRRLRACHNRDRDDDIRRGPRPRLAARAALAALVSATALGLFGATPARAQPDDSVADFVDADVPTVFVMGNIEFILLHELAHLVIRDLEVPIVGSEESAADYIATLVLIEAASFAPDLPPRARRYLAATANGLASSWELFARSGRSANYWDSHALTIQRHYQIVCLLYGSDPESFAELPARVGMPEGRSRLCRDEYARASRALQWLLDNYGLGEERGGSRPRPDIDVDFERPPSQVSARIAEAIRRNRMVENTLDRLYENFDPPAPFRIVFHTCAQTQAGWVPDMRELYVCYELLDYYYSLALTEPARTRRSLLENR